MCINCVGILRTNGGPFGGTWRTLVHRTLSSSCYNLIDHMLNDFIS